jgi:hypothetical protein
VIFSQTAGSTCDFWVDPVKFTLVLCQQVLRRLSHLCHHQGARLWDSNGAVPRPWPRPLLPPCAGIATCNLHAAVAPVVVVRERQQHAAEVGGQPPGVINSSVSSCGSIFSRLYGGCMVVLKMSPSLSPGVRTQ